MDNDLDLAGALRAQICFAGALRTQLWLSSGITLHAYRIMLTLLSISWLHDAFRHQSHLSKATEGMLRIS